MAEHTKLLFIDTNILLDFYRCRTDAALSLLRHLDSIRGKIIMTYQVEMEFKKNRQAAILESLKELKAPANIPRPALFSDAKRFKDLQKSLKDAEEHLKHLKENLKGVFQKPESEDEVFKVTEALFRKTDDISLGRDKKTRFQIRRLAWKRFILGYPPRKPGDTSTGDAINWEWIVHCAKAKGADIMIVSRDSDYGVTLDDKSFLNDWLIQEFKERAGEGRTVRLYNRLSDALPCFNVSVTKEETEAEIKFLQFRYGFAEQAQTTVMQNWQNSRDSTYPAASTPHTDLSAIFGGISAKPKKPAKSADPE